MNFRRLAAPTPCRKTAPLVNRRAAETPKCSLFVLVMFASLSYKHAMNVEHEILTPAPPQEIAETIAFALRYSGRKRVNDSSEMMATIVAKRLVEHLQRSRPAVLPYLITVEIDDSSRGRKQAERK